MSAPTTNPAAPAVAASAVGVAAVQRQPLLLQLLRRRRLAFCGLVFLALLVAGAVLAPWLTSYDPTMGALADSTQGPSAAHLLGTDQLGRDILTRLLYGARPTLAYTLEAVLVAMVFGLPLGIWAGFRGGVVDRVLVAVTDVLMAMPGMVVLLVVLSVFADHLQYAMVALGLLLFSPFTKVVRGATLAVRQEVFIDAARVAGLSNARIMARHVLPRIQGTMLVQGAILTGLALLLNTGLAYLGFGTQPPAPSWGLMIGDGAQVFSSSPWLLLFSGGIVALTVIACGLVADGLRDLVVERWKGVTPRRPRRRRRARGTAHAAPVATAAGGALLSVSELDVSYRTPRGEVTVVHGASLSVAAGETVGLLGESGSGKTAIARAVLGILRNGRISGGNIVLDGVDITGISDFDAGERADLRFGYISQEPHISLDPTWRVGALIEQSVMRHQKLGRRAARARMIELLELVRLPDPQVVARRYPHQLSGGMAQRVAIARALAGDPRLLIADEPTTALDVTVQAEILDLLRSIQQRTGMAILLITHDWGVVADLCERACVMRAGIVVETATVVDLFRRPAHEYTAQLLAADPAVLHGHAGAPGPGSPRPTEDDAAATAARSPADTPRWDVQHDEHSEVVR